MHVRSKQTFLPSVKWNSVWKPYTNLPDTPVALACASKYFQLLFAPRWSITKCSQTLQEHYHVFLKAHAGIEAHSRGYLIWQSPYSNCGGADTSVSVCWRRREQLRLGAIFSQRWVFGFHNDKGFHRLYWSLWEWQDRLHHDMACNM